MKFGLWYTTPDYFGAFIDYGRGGAVVAGRQIFNGATYWRSE
jgi:hypothetical protein